MKNTFKVSLLFFLLSIGGLRAQQIQTASIPDWAEQNELGDLLDTIEQRVGNEYEESIIVYTEVQVNADTEETLQKSVSKIKKSPMGFYELGLVHSLKDTERQYIGISRFDGGTESDLTGALNRSELVQNDYVYNKLWESITRTSFTIDRVRVGDLFSLSYLDKSLRSDHSISQGFVYSCFDSTYVNFRLISKAPLQHKSNNGFPAVTVREYEDHYEYTAKGFATARYREPAEGKVITSPFIVFSEFTRLEEIGLNYRGLLHVDEASKQSLDILYAKLAGQGVNDSVKIRNIINYVQDTMLYQEYGLYESYQPDWCIKGNRGDCKAKTLITVELLKRAGIEAYPILVNYPYFSEQLRATPSKASFNHVITQFIFNGDTSLVDPTATKQTDKIGDYPVNNYGTAVAVYDDEARVLELSGRNRGSIKVIDTISDRVRRKIILDGALAEEYVNYSGYSSTIGSIFSDRYYRIGAPNRSIQNFSMFEYEDEYTASPVKMEVYNSTSQDSVVLTQEITCPDTLVPSFLPSGTTFYDMYPDFGLEDEEDDDEQNEEEQADEDSYPGSLPVPYENQTTRAVYIKEPTTFRREWLDSIPDNFVLDSKFGRYTSTISEDELAVTIEQNIQIAGSVSAADVGAFEQFKHDVEVHTRWMHRLIGSGNREDNGVEEE